MVLFSRPFMPLYSGSASGHLDRASSGKLSFRLNSSTMRYNSFSLGHHWPTSISRSSSCVSFYNYVTNITELSSSVGLIRHCISHIRRIQFPSKWCRGRCIWGHLKGPDILVVRTRTLLTSYNSSCISLYFLLSLSVLLAIDHRCVHLLDTPSEFSTSRHRVRNGHI